MIKVSFFQSESVNGPVAVPLFGPQDAYFEKTAAPLLLPDVSKYIETLRPRSDAQYVLVNAMGASEYYGSNVNGDAFPEASLIHCPDDWRGIPALDAIKAKTWPYGFPTFYEAHPYAHHRNKDSSKAFGNVELACWHPQMKRVELVVRVDKDKCDKFGGTGVWDKLKIGEFPDVSMGTKVPYDTCSICLDWDRYRKAQATFDPKKHKHAGDAVLEVHKQKPIRGVSITRKDYCEHARKQMNKILPDGRKVFVYNDYPKFFDISFVFIGADKTAKTMLKIAGEGRSFYYQSNGAELAEKLGYEDENEKTASSKVAKDKEGEIIKEVVPSQFAGKAVPLLTKREGSIPRDLLDLMGRTDTKKALSTATALGIVLRPHEFQRVVLIRMGCRRAADELDELNAVFPSSKETSRMDLSSDDFHAALAKLLLPLMAMRSGFGPVIERRVVVLAGREDEEKLEKRSSLSSSLLHKMGSVYNGYRAAVMDLVGSAQEMIDPIESSDPSLSKIASASPEELFTPLSFQYFQNAFRDEVGTGNFEYNTVKQAGGTSADVERGFPSRNT